MHFLYMAEVCWFTIDGEKKNTKIGLAIVFIPTIQTLTEPSSLNKKFLFFTVIMGIQIISQWPVVSRAGEARASDPQKNNFSLSRPPGVPIFW